MWGVLVCQDACSCGHAQADCYTGQPVEEAWPTPATHTPWSSAL